MIEPNYQGENWIASPALLPHVAQAEEGMEIHYCDDFFHLPQELKSDHSGPQALDFTENC